MGVDKIRIVGAIPCGCPICRAEEYLKTVKQCPVRDRILVEKENPSSPSTVPYGTECG